MPEMWLSLRTRSIISHLKLTHLKAICKCSSMCRTRSEGRGMPFPSQHQRTLAGAPHTPSGTGPHAQHSFQEQQSINRDKKENEQGRETGTGLKWQVTSSLHGNDPGVRYSALGVGALGVTRHHWGSSTGLCLRAVPQLAPSPHRPRDANPCLISDDSPGSSTPHPLTPLLGLTREEEGNILLFSTIVLTLPF